MCNMVPGCICIQCIHLSSTQGKNHAKFNTIHVDVIHLKKDILLYPTLSLGVYSVPYVHPSVHLVSATQLLNRIS